MSLDERDFKISDFITASTTIGLEEFPTLREYIESNKIIIKKIKAFSVLLSLIEDNALKELFDEYFKEYI